MTLEFLRQMHEHLTVACRNANPDEDVHDLRQQRRKIAHMIAFWNEPPSGK